MTPCAMSDTPSPQNDRPDHLIDALVAQTLDDLEEQRFDVATALRKVASLAWAAASQRRSATREGPVDQPETGGSW